MLALSPQSFGGSPCLNFLCQPFASWLKSSFASDSCPLEGVASFRIFPLDAFIVVYYRPHVP